MTDLVLLDSLEKRNQLFNYLEEHWFGLRYICCLLLMCVCMYCGQQWSDQHPVRPASTVENCVFCNIYLFVYKFTYAKLAFK